jgi:hypothetical protein
MFEFAPGTSSYSNDQVVISSAPGVKPRSGHTFRKEKREKREQRNLRFGFLRWPFPPVTTRRMTAIAKQHHRSSSLLMHLRRRTERQRVVTGLATRNYFRFLQINSCERENVHKVSFDYTKLFDHSCSLTTRPTSAGAILLESGIHSISVH